MPLPRWIELHWTPADAAPTRRDRIAGTYRAYLPKLLAHRDLHIPEELSLKAAQVEHKIRNLAAAPAHKGLEGVTRFLLRSEAVSSSRIEGLAPAADKVAIAELSDSDDRIVKVTDTARAVAANVKILDDIEATDTSAEKFSLERLLTMQRTIIARSALHGIRKQQNWIGGSDWHPLDAEFVPPPPIYVPDLLEDLIRFINGAAHGPLIQAAIAHAQFETIHPFADGNGRVGRAVIHTILQRRGLCPSPILPLSMVLATWSDKYLAGLSAFRALDDETRNSTVDTRCCDTALAAWVDTFLTAADIAADEAQRLFDDINELQTEWNEKFSCSRSSERKVRTDSLTARLLSSLISQPMLTVDLVAQAYGVSANTARAALNELTSLKILTRRSVGKNVHAFLAMDVFALVSAAERQLASTRFNTKLSPPRRGGIPNIPTAPAPRDR